jgi:hypothetical protein
LVDANATVPLILTNPNNPPNRHLYRNALFARLRLPFRFMALVQVDVTDLKPALIGPGGGLGLAPGQAAAAAGGQVSKAKQGREG